MAISSARGRSSETLKCTDITYENNRFSLALTACCLDILSLSSRQTMNPWQWWRLPFDGQTWWSTRVYISKLFDFAPGSTYVHTLSIYERHNDGTSSSLLKLKRASASNLGMLLPYHTGTPSLSLLLRTTVFRRRICMWCFLLLVSICTKEVA
jgi:hypothetical protein